MNKIAEFLINNYHRREAVISGLAESGYFVTTEERPKKGEENRCYPNKDIWVIVCERQEESK